MDHVSRLERCFSSFCFGQGEPFSFLFKEKVFQIVKVLNNIFKAYTGVMEDFMNYLRKRCQSNEAPK